MADMGWLKEYMGEWRNFSFLSRKILHHTIENQATRKHGFNFLFIGIPALHKHTCMSSGMYVKALNQVYT